MRTAGLFTVPVSRGLHYFRSGRTWLIVAGYAFFAALWIYYSDQALVLLVDDPGERARWSVAKGLGFVLITSALLFLLVRGAFGAIESGYVRLVAHERELERTQRLYAALSQINQAIVWSKDRPELFEKVCGVLVEHGGFRMAWIGWHDPATRLLVPAAQCGDHNGYLAGVRISADGSVPEGQGPSGTAFREERTVVCNDILSHPVSVVGRKEASRSGLRASAAFPIRRGGQLAGTLNVYAAEPGFFQDKELALLEEAAGDISFALDNLDREEQRRQSEETVRNERRFTDGIIESMPGILYLYDTSGRFLRWNRNFETVSGFSGAEIQERHPLDFFLPADQPMLKQRIQEVFERGESSVQAPFLCRDGSTIPHFFTGRRVEFNGQTCLVGVGVDISDRVCAEAELARSEQRYRSTLDQMIEGCQILGQDWTYLYVNPAAEAQNRRPAREVLGRRMQEVWPGIEQAEVYAAFRRCMETRTAQHLEALFHFPDGHEGWFDVSIQPIPEGIFILSVDITERHQAEQALRQLNADLERKVAERTVELESARVRAESADRLKSAFLATMSHELRTPLNSIIGFTGIVLQQLPGPLNAEQSKQLGMVQSSARHLLDLINDVLDISKIEAGQFDIYCESFDLREAITRAAATVRPMAEQKGLGLTVEIDPAIGSFHGDRRRIGQVLLNLLNNAIKFTERGGVTLRADVELREGSPWLRLRVTDTGMGIRAEDLPHLFQPFRQIDAGLTRQHEGTGLGLAICRRLAGLMGGSITVESKPGRGSTFTLHLP
jgi:PAS domain S-box-containing protein